jgi:hypothetical protein
MMTTLLALALTLGLAGADWQPVSFGPRTSAIIATRLAVTCFGRVPPVAYQLTQSGVAVKVGGRGTRTACTQASVNAAMQYRSELPEGTAVKVTPYDYLRGVVLSHPTPEGVAELHRLTTETLSAARK